MALSPDEIAASLRAKSQPRKEGDAQCPNPKPTVGNAAPSVQPAPAAADNPDPHPSPSPATQERRHQRPTRQSASDRGVVAMPQNFEAEQALIGSMLVPFAGEGKIATLKARDALGGAAFFDPRHQILFMALCDMFTQGTPIDIVTLGEYLREHKIETQAGGPAYYTSLFVHVPTAANVDQYIEMVREKYTLRELYRAAAENARQALEPDADVGNLLGLAHQRLALIESGTTRFGRLPGLADISGMLNGQKPPRPPDLITGLLHQGSKLIVGGTSKGRKTFSLIDLGVSVAAGVPWWGFETVKGPICYINFEIQESFFCERTEDICRVKHVTLDPGMFMGWNLRGHGEGIENIVEEIMAKLLTRQFVLVIFDPIYKALGDRDENKAGDVASLCNQLERVAVKTGAAIAFGAHYSKGNQAMKESIDRIGGSGVFARDPDSILTMTTHEEADCFTVEATLRNFKPIEPFVVKWDWPLFTREGDLDPADLKQQKRRSSGEYSGKYTKDMILNELSVIDGIRPSKLFNKLAEMEGMSRAQFYRLFKALREQKQVSESDGLWFKVASKPE